MESNNLVVASSNAKIRKGDEDGGNDVISSLPDPVLVYILSLLPTRDAVRTVMVPRFRYLWTFARNLSFDQCAFHNCEEYSCEFDEVFLNFINHVLTLHDSPTIDSFRLKMEFGFIDSTDEGVHDDTKDEDHVMKERRMSNKIDTWIRFAVKKKVKFLDLDFLGCGFGFSDIPYRLPSIVLKCSYLVELKLTGCDVKVLGPIHLKLLRKLSLKEIVLSEKILGEIVSSCPLLGELSLAKCYGLRKLQFNRHPSIKELNLDMCEGLEKLDLACSDANKLTIVVDPRNRVMEIVCPNIRTLNISGSIECVNLSNYSSLIDASLYFSHHFKCARKSYRRFRVLLEKLSSCVYFMPCTWCILLELVEDNEEMVFSIWELTQRPCPSFAWKHLTLELSLTKWHLPGISSILRSSHILESLTIFVYPGCQHIFTLNEAKWMQKYDFEGENYWSSFGDTLHCVKHHMKNVMIYGYVTEPFIAGFIGFLLKNCLTLEKMVISTKKTLPPPRNDRYMFYRHVTRQKDYYTSEMLLEFSQKVLSFPRASARAMIHFS